MSATLDPIGATLEAAADPRAVRRDRSIWPVIWTVAVAALLYWGMHAHLERYLTPQRGLGYAFGIAGGSMMLLLLLYSARKRFAWLRWMGAIPSWFQFHMVLGVLGPILILFHADFRLGATNSNVALFSMLLVAASGVVGRYIYTRLHARLDGSAASLEQLRAIGDRLRAPGTSIDFLPSVMDAIESIERRYIAVPPRGLARSMHLLTGPVRMARARHLVRREIRIAVRRVRERDATLAGRSARRLAVAARRYAYRRFDAGRRVAETKAYARMFSWWHVLHIPLFFLLLIAGIAHVIAVNLY